MSSRLFFCGVRQLSKQRCSRINRRYSSASCSASSSKTDLKEVMREKIKEHRDKVIQFRKEHAKSKLGDATVGMIYGGLRGLPAMLCETSAVDPDEGIRFRGLSIPELLCKLPKPKSGNQPFPEGLFWLLCTGDVPTGEQVEFVRQEWICRSELPQHVIDLLLGLPKQLHPMAQLSAALTAMSVCSEFARKYNTVKKECMWELMYEDCMDLLAKLISVAAIIYTHTYRSCGMKPIIEDGNCWTRNFCLSMTYDDKEFIDFMRLYLILHSHHGSGDVSAHTVHLVGSALSDCYLAMAAGINGLAGPLHGLANQEVWKFITELMSTHGQSPSDDQVKSFVDEKLKSGVIPGYGHAVLRKVDPRFTAQKQFCEKVIPHDPGVKIVWQIFKIVPPALQALKKVHNPWPNVDAHSGAILQAFKMCEMNYYAVLFGVSRALGTMAWLIWARALLLPLERPNSYTTDELMKMVGQKGGGETCKTFSAKPKEEKPKQDTCKKLPMETKKDVCKPEKPKQDTCKKTETKKDVCKSEMPKENTCKKTETKKDVFKSEKPKQDTCKKTETKKDVCKSEKPKENTCKTTEIKKDVCKSEKHKQDTCKKTEIEKDVCKSENPREETCKAEKSKDSCKSEDPCKKKEDPCKKKEDPCKKKEDPCKKKEDPCKKKEDPCKKKEDPCKKKEDPCKKKEDPCKKKEDPCKKKEDPCKKKEDSCKKKDDSSNPKEDTC